MGAISTVVKLAAIILMFCATMLAQTSGGQTKHFAKDGLSFDYPAGTTMEDESRAGGQHLVLTNGAHGAQIEVISRYEKIDSAEQLTKAEREVDAYVNDTTEKLKKKHVVKRIETKIEVAGFQVPGVRLRVVFGGVLPGNFETYSLQLGKRLVVLTFIGTDKEQAAAAVAWAMVRHSLKVEDD